MPKDSTPETTMPKLPDIREFNPPKYKVTQELMASMKTSIMEWLAGDINMNRIDFKLSFDDSTSSSVLFQRFVINARTCSNSWEEIHIASSCMWPETYALTKRGYCDNNSVHKPRNEVTSETAFFHECQLNPWVREAARVLNFEGDQGND